MNKRLTCKSPTRAPASRSSDESQHEQQLCNQQLISASPHHTLTPGGRRKQQFCSQLWAFNDHRWFCKSELLAILCTHNTDVHLQGVECISCVCGVKAVECRSQELLSTQPYLPTSAMTLQHHEIGFTKAALDYSQCSCLLTLGLIININMIESFTT